MNRIFVNYMFSGFDAVSILGQRLSATAIILLLGLGFSKNALGQVDYGLLWLEVSETGIHRVTFEELRDFGLDLNGVDPDLIALTSRGEPVQIHVTRDGKGRPNAFGPGWYVEFIGEGIEDSLYTKTNVYQLHLDDELVARVDVDKSKPKKNASIAKYFMETNWVDDDKGFYYVAPTGEPWYLTYLYFTKPGSRDFDIEIDGLVAGAAPATLQTEMWGFVDWPEVKIDHHVRLHVNGEFITEGEFSGLESIFIGDEVPTGTLRTGTNQVTFELPLDTGAAADFLAINRFGITYPRNFSSRDGRTLRFTASSDAFEATGFADTESVAYRRLPDGHVQLIETLETSEGESGTHNVLLAGTELESEYFIASASSGLGSPMLIAPPEKHDLIENEADYVIIAHPDFIGPDADGNDPLSDLLLHRQNKGMTTSLIELDQLFAQFSHGIVDAQAIKRFITEAYLSIGTRMVLLVGGDTVDYHNNFNNKYEAVSFVPSLYAKTGPVIDFAPVDPMYGDVDLDNVPDLAIGRFPVRTRAELDEIVNKTFAWELRNGGNTALLIADKYDSNNQYNFKADSEQIFNDLPVSWQQNATKVYVDDLGQDLARQRLFETLNRGPILTSFFGHSSFDRWTFDGLFSSIDTRNLTNNLLPTLVTQWGCWNTYYVAPQEHTMGHEFLLNGEQGAAALVGASTLTQAKHERILASYLFDEMFTPGKTVGMAILDAKVKLSQVEPEALDVLLGWTLLGDPGISLVP